MPAIQNHEHVHLSPLSAEALDIVKSRPERGAGCSLRNHRAADEQTDHIVAISAAAALERRGLVTIFERRLSKRVVVTHVGLNAIVEVAR